jgi:hypothetical protein
VKPFRAREMDQGRPHGPEPERELLAILLRGQSPDPVEQRVAGAEQDLIVFEDVQGSLPGSRECALIQLIERSEGFERYPDSCRR